MLTQAEKAFSAARVQRTLGMLGEVVGLAASVCKTHGCMPREVYRTHLDELKDRMRKGVPIRTSFVCSDINASESYHFKDLGWWQLHTGKCLDNRHVERKETEREIADFRYAVDALGMTHKYPLPEKWSK